MSALQAGVSGLLAEQTRMDAVGNNIATPTPWAIRAWTCCSPTRFTRF